MVEAETYERAYLCGGPRRVVLVALVALAADEQVKVAHALHRVRVVRRDPRDPVEAAVLDAVPAAGRTLGALIAAAAATMAVAEVGETLRGRRLIARRPWQLGRLLRARGRRRRLRASGLPDGPDRIAVLGPEGILDERLRRTVSTPDPDFALPDLDIPGMPDHNDRPYDARQDARTANRLDSFGPGGPWAGL